MNKILLIILTTLTFISIQPAQDPSQRVREFQSANVQCAICLENMLPVNTITNLQCNHIFHTECVDTWLTNHNTCPICRADVRRTRQLDSILEELNILRQSPTNEEVVATLRMLNLQFQTHINTQEQRIEVLEQRLRPIQERQGPFLYFKNMAIIASISFFTGIISAGTIENIMSYGISTGVSGIQNYFINNTIF